jgi:hypothetical protein
MLILQALFVENIAGFGGFVCCNWKDEKQGMEN